MRQGLLRGSAYS